jgi:hypothetical protein
MRLFILALLAAASAEVLLYRATETSVNVLRGNKLYTFSRVGAQVKHIVATLRAGQSVKYERWRCSIIFCRILDI